MLLENTTIPAPPPPAPQQVDHHQHCRGRCVVVAAYLWIVIIVPAAEAAHQESGSSSPSSSIGWIIVRARQCMYSLLSNPAEEGSAMVRTRPARCRQCFRLVKKIGARGQVFLRAGRSSSTRLPSSRRK